MNSVIMITQFFFTLVIGMYFFTKLRNEKSTVKPLQTIQKKRLNTLIVCVIYIYLTCDGNVKT